MYIYIYIYVYIYIHVCMYMYMYDGYTTSVLPFLLGEQLSVPSFEKGGSEKMTVWANLKSFCHAEYLPRGLAVFLVKKKTLKDKIWL